MSSESKETNMTSTKTPKIIGAIIFGVFVASLIWAVAIEFFGA